MIRVLLVDDHASFRQPLAFMLEREPDCTVAAQAGSLAEARTAMAGAVDVAVIDLNLPDGDGVDLVKEMRVTHPDGAVLVLSATTDRRQMARAVEAGANGVLNKSVGIDQIIGAVRMLQAGETLIPSREVIELLRLAGQQRFDDETSRRVFSQLTPRERDVLQALADGLTDKEIAHRLHVSRETVRTHMVNLLAKLGVESRLQALVFAVRHGAVRID